MSAGENSDPQSEFFKPKLKTDDLKLKSRQQKYLLKVG